jgi:hypothetical protein
VEHVTKSNPAFINAVTSANDTCAAVNEATVVATKQPEATIAANKATATTNTFDNIPTFKQRAFLISHQASDNGIKLLQNWVYATNKVTRLAANVAAFVLYVCHVL